MEDKELIGLFFERSEEAIPEAERKYGKLCFSVAKNVLGNEEDAKECLNDALLALWNKIPPEVPASLSAFIGKIARNIALNRFRKNTAEKRRGNESTAVLDEISEFVSGSDNIEETFEQRELIAEINEFLGTLPKEKRRIFVARYWLFESIADIAKRTGRNEKFIHNTLGRTRTKLKKYLEERGFEL